MSIATAEQIRNRPILVAIPGSDLQIACRRPDPLDLIARDLLPLELFHAVLDRVVDQGAPAPFDPRAAVTRFAAVLKEFHLSAVTGDKYAGETFKCDFSNAGIAYRVSDRTKSELYEALEPLLNAQSVILVDEPTLEQQLLGLVWRGGKIDHPGGEHDDWANAAAGVIVQVSAGASELTAEQIAEIDRINEDAAFENLITMHAVL
jgi:hypothetical protein